MKQLIFRIFFVLINGLILSFLCLHLATRLGSFDNVYNRRIALLAENKKLSPKIVLVGGSNLLYSINTEELNREIGIPVFNTGFYGGYTIKFYIEDAMRYLNAGDILIACPEYENFTGTWFCASNELLKFIIKNDINKYSLLSDHERSSFLLNFPGNALDIIVSTLKFAKDISLEKYPLIGGPWNRFVDQTSHYGQKAQSVNFDMQIGSVNDEIFVYLKSIESKLKFKGIYFYMDSAALANHSYLINREKLKAVQTAMIRYRLPYLSSIRDTLFTDAEVFNTAYHLNRAGVIKRTTLLGKRLSDLLKTKSFKTTS